MITKHGGFVLADRDNGLPRETIVTKLFRIDPRQQIPLRLSKEIRLPPLFVLRNRAIGFPPRKWHTNIPVVIVNKHEWHTSHIGYCTRVRLLRNRLIATNPQVSIGGIAPSSLAA